MKTFVLQMDDMASQESKEVLRLNQQRKNEPKAPKKRKEETAQQVEQCVGVTMQLQNTIQQLVRSEGEANQMQLAHQQVYA